MNTAMTSARGPNDNPVVRSSDNDEFWQAVLSRDARFDGRIFSACARPASIAALRARQEGRAASRLFSFTFPRPPKVRVFDRAGAAVLAPLPRPIRK